MHERSPGLAELLKTAGIYPPALRTLDAIVPLSLAFLCAFAFTIALSNTISNAILAAVVIGSIPFLLWSAELRRNPVVILSFLWCLFVVFVALRATVEQSPGHHIRSVGKDFLLALSPVLAIQIAVIAARSRFSQPTIWALVLGCGSLGVTALLFHDPNWRAGLEMFAEYDKVTAAFNRNYMAFVCGMALLATVTVAVWACEESGLPRGWRVAVTGASTVLLLVMALALFTLQSRSSWLAAAVGLLLWVLTFVAVSLRRKRDVLRAGVVAALFVVLVSMLAVSYAPKIQQRLAHGGGMGLNVTAAKELLLGRPEKVEAIAAEIDPRYRLFLVATDLIGRKPSLGWGPDVTSLIPLFSPYDDLKNYTQFHNGYLQFLVSLGFVGAVFKLLLIAAIVRDAWRARGRDGSGPPRGSAALKAAFASLLAFNLVVNVTESGFFLNAGAMAMILLAAALCLNGSIGADTRATLSRMGRVPPDQP